MSKKRVSQKCSFVLGPFERNDEACKLQIFNGNDHSVKVIIEKVKNGVKVTSRGAVIAVAIWMGFMAAADAKQIMEYDDLAVHAILGEARGEGYEAMYAHACAIRNRGLNGVYGKNADVSDASEEIVQKAYKAWAESEQGQDITNGATHWLSDYDLSRTTSWKSWIEKYKQTARFGTTNFYKLK